jgi:hypothetical protein
MPSSGRHPHAAAILDANGGLVAQVEVEASQGGYEQLLGFVTQQAPGRRCWALEGTGCFGAGPGRDPGRPGSAQPPLAGPPAPAGPARGATGQLAQ